MIKCNRIYLINNLKSNHYLIMIDFPLLFNIVPLKDRIGIIEYKISCKLRFDTNFDRLKVF